MQGESNLVDRIKAVLTEDGFTHIKTHSSPHAVTISGDKEQIQAVFHMTDQQEQPQNAVANEKAPATADIKVTPTFPWQVSTAPDVVHVGDHGPAPTEKAAKPERR